MNRMKFHQLFNKVLQQCFAASAVFSGTIFSMWVSDNNKFNSRGDLLRLPAPLILLTDQWWAIPVIISFFLMLWWQKEVKPNHTTLFSHSAFRRSNTTALQQLPVSDHGGRMNTQMKGSARGERRLSARLKKCEALRPQTSARPSSLSNAGDGEKQTTRDHRCHWMY